MQGLQQRACGEPREPPVSCGRAVGCMNSGCLAKSTANIYQAVRFFYPQQRHPGLRDEMFMAGVDLGLAAFTAARQPPLEHRIAQHAGQ